MDGTSSKNQEWNVEMTNDDKMIKLVLINRNNNQVSKIIARSEFIIENVHQIGRSLEYEYNKTNNVILEPYNISRIIGLVNDLILAESDK
jgi:hypothetical protein|tara:strand:- start:10169 stop:10438 length:270 start_codon:yes stop_codon:yes gene_type:complete